MSTTGPVTRAMRPTAPAAVDGRDRRGCGVSHVSLSSAKGCYLADDSASAPPTISEICWVISDWRALFARRV